ncbi:MAG: hypothetical protein JWR85_4055 [Marmoricola sp.]|nr:hypothetical protein [Marmoricola sp.]
MEIDWTQLPKLPEGYFFRIKEGWFFGSTVVVQTRRRYRLGRLQWSRKVDSSWSTRELMKRSDGQHASSDQEVAWRIARRQATDLWARIRPVDLGALAGDHPSA